MRAAAGEAGQVGADAASHFEQPLAGEAAEVDELGQVAQLVEAIVVEIGEELAAAHRMRGHLEIVDALVPVAADLIGGHSPLSYNVRLMRDLRRLADDTFDLLVVGAGIYGALAAWDAAQRGLRVALVDRGDFGGGTSFNSLKTLHGGLRSLQSLSLAQMRLFIRERRALARMAPHLVRPCPSVSRPTAISRAVALALRAALAVTDAVGADRNAGIDDPSLQLPRGRIVSRDECLALNPLIDPAGVTGGAVWFDYQMRQAERVVLAAVQSAEACGAVAANYVEARGLVRAGATRGRRPGRRPADRRTFRRAGHRGAERRRSVGRRGAARLLDAAPPLAGGAAVAGDEPGRRPRHRDHACGGCATAGSSSSCRGATSRSSAPATTSTTATPMPRTARPARRGPARRRAAGVSARRSDALGGAAGPPRPAADGRRPPDPASRCSRKARSSIMPPAATPA